MSYVAPGIPGFTGDPIAKTLPNLLTASQISDIVAAAARAGLDVDGECRRVFGCAHIDLTKQAAAALISHLRSLPRAGAAEGPGAGPEPRTATSGG